MTIAKFQHNQTVRIPSADRSATVITTNRVTRMVLVLVDYGTEKASVWVHEDELEAA